MILSQALKILSVLSLVSTTVLASVGVGRIDSTKFRTVRYGPFSLLNHVGDTVRVFVDIGHVYLDTAEFRGGWPESDYSTTFIDDHGTVLSRSVGRYDDAESSTTIRPAQLIVPKIGPLVLLMSQTVPSAPPICTEGQLFGFDRFDHLVPFSSSVIACGDMVSDSFRPVLVKVKMNREPETEFANGAYLEPAIETDDCMPNFTIFHLDPVWWGHSSSLIFNQTKYRIQVDTAAASRSRTSYRESNADTLVTLYSKPSLDSARDNTIRLSPTSSFSFKDAVNQKGWWLHVVIDGHEGYVVQAEFPKLGLSDVY